LDGDRLVETSLRVFTGLDLIQYMDFPTLAGRFSRDIWLALFFKKKKKLIDIGFEMVFSGFG